MKPLTLFLKPVLFPLTNTANATLALWWSIGVRRAIFMPFRAMSFQCIKSTQSKSSERINLCRDQLQVAWAHTGAVTAEMIPLKFARRLANEKVVGKSDLSRGIKKDTVTLRGERSRPHPTITRFINVLPKNLLTFFGAKRLLDRRLILHSLIINHNADAS